MEKVLEIVAQKNVKQSKEVGKNGKKEIKYVFISLFGAIVASF